jgi:hypothetical protein
MMFLLSKHFKEFLVLSKNAPDLSGAFFFVNSLWLLIVRTVTFTDL